MTDDFIEKLQDQVDEVVALAENYKAALAEARAEAERLQLCLETTWRRPPIRDDAGVLAEYGALLKAEAALAEARADNDKLRWAIGNYIKGTDAVGHSDWVEFFTDVLPAPPAEEAQDD